MKRLIFSILVILTPVFAYADLLAVLPANETSARCAGNTDATAGAGNFGAPAATTRDILFYNNDQRIRQAGNLTSVKIYIADKTDITSIRIKIWRRASAANYQYNKVGQSELFAGASLTSAAINTLTFASPIAVVQGDHIGLTIINGGVGEILPFTSSVNTYTSTYYVDSEASDTGFLWRSQTGTTSYIIIEGYMQSPQFVMMGDSITSGYGVTRCFREQLDSANVTYESWLTDYSYNLGSDLSSMPTYQVMGVSGQKASDGAARVATDITAINPRYVIVMFGINDAASNISVADYTTSYNTILSAVTGISAIPIVVAPTPSALQTTAQRQRVDDYIDALPALVPEGGYYVNCNDWIGKHREGGDAGNLWDLQTAYSADGTHLNAAGYSRLGQCIYTNVFNSIACTQGRCTGYIPFK